MTSESYAQGDASNLVFNSGMEAWSDKNKMADGWSYNWYTRENNEARGEMTQVVEDAASAYSGTRYLRIKSTPGHKVSRVIYSVRHVPATRSEKYVVAVKARGQGRLRLGVLEKNKAQNKGFLVGTFQTEFVNAKEAWTTYSWAFQPTRQETDQIDFAIIVEGDVSFDDAVLMKAGDFSHTEQDTSVAVPQNQHVTIPYLNTPPRLDGKLEKGEWTSTAGITGFLDRENQLAEQQTVVRLGYDERNLYVAFISSSPTRMKAEIKEHDGPVYLDDAFEIFLMPDPNGKTYYQLIGNPIGTRYESKGTDVSWSEPWQLACGQEYGEFLVASTWTAEIAIPFKSLGLNGPPQEGQLWKVNFCRDQATASRPGGDRFTTWGLVGGTFHDPSRFATMTFSHKPAFVQLDSLGNLLQGNIALKGHVAGAKGEQLNLNWYVVENSDDPSSPKAKGAQEVMIRDGATAFDMQGDLLVSSSKPWPVKLVVIARDSQGRVLLQNVTPYEVIPGFRVDLSPVYLEGKLHASFNIKQLPDIPPDAVGRIRVLDLSGKAVVEGQAPTLGVYKQSDVILDIASLAPGDYLVEVSLLDAQGTVLRAKTDPFPIPKRPQWADAGLGLSDRVPPPFTDVVVGDKQVSVWGRTYQLGENLLPSQIDIQGHELLAEPIRLVYGDSSGVKDWEHVSTQQVKAKPTQVTFTYRADNAEVALSGQMTAEYDGFMMYEIELTPLKDQVTLSTLRVEIPLHRKSALFLRATDTPIQTPPTVPHEVCAVIGDVEASQTIKPNGFYAFDFEPHGWRWAGGFIPQVWVGNDRRGLFIFQDSPQFMNWKGSPVEIQRRGDMTTLVVHFINIPTSITEPIRYRFALQATPVKKRQRKLERMLCINPGVLKSMAKRGLDTSMIPTTLVWNVGRIEKDYKVTRPEELRDNVAVAGKYGSGAVLNQAPSYFATPALDSDLYGPEWYQHPRSGYPNHEGTDITLSKVCPASSFTDYYLWWAKHLIDDYGLNGLYFDITGPYACKNPLHGHGYVKDGQRHVVSDIFAFRELSKRIYTMVKEEGRKRGKDFYVFQHSNPGVCSPFIDHNTRGELWVNAPNWDTLSPLYFRTCENLVAYGTPFTFYPSVSIPWRRTPEGLHLSTHDEILARTLIHDVFPLAIWDKQLDDLFPLWEAWDRFGVEDASWVGYFDNDPRVMVSSKELLVSFYQRPGRTLIVVSNLTDHTVKSNVQLDLAALSLPDNNLRIHAIRSGKQQSMIGRRFPVVLGKKNVEVFLVKSAEN